MTTDTRTPRPIPTRRTLPTPSELAARARRNAATPIPAPPLTVNAVLALFVEGLNADGVPDPLTQEFSLFAIWDDLARLMGETPPAFVTALVDGPALSGLVRDDGLAAMAAAARAATPADPLIEVR